MFTFEKIIKDLKEGYILSFIYMEKEHTVMSLDNTHYIITKYTHDNHNKREEKMIVPKKVLKEMYKDMKEITYSY